MAIKKELEVEKDVKKELIKFLQTTMPSMFNSYPDITGDLNKFADDIIKITK